MASFEITGPGWTEIIAAGGSVDRVVQVNRGKVLVSFGTPDPMATNVFSSTADNRITYVPAGIAINVKAETVSAHVTTGDY